jgi:hypothetical protein
VQILARVLSRLALLARVSRKATTGDHVVEAFDGEREVGPLTVIALVKGPCQGSWHPQAGVVSASRLGVEHDGAPEWDNSGSLELHRVRPGPTVKFLGHRLSSTPGTPV